MADPPKPPGEKPGIPPEQTDVPEEPVTGSHRSDIKPAMSEQEIRDAGLVVDVPFESGVAEPERLKYADLGPDHKYEDAGAAPPAEPPPDKTPPG